MTEERAIRLAREWAFGGVCTLQDGEAQEYHKLALLALEAMRDGAVPVVRCGWCIMHGNCTTEDTFNCSGMDMDKAFCCAGKRKDDDGKKDGAAGGAFQWMMQRFQRRV